MKKYLPYFVRPSQYLGTETNAIYKDPQTVKLRIGLAFPDLYEVGMSYYGHKILYQEINQIAEFWAERVFAPHLEVARVLKKNKVPLATLESDTPLAELDVLGFSLTNELAYTTVLYMLDLANIPFWARERGEDYPLVVAGGGVTFNAEPVAPFFDLMFLGDGEGLLVSFLKKYLRAKENNLSKQEFLFSLKGEPGIYVPEFFEVRFDGFEYNIVPSYHDYTKVRRYILAELNQSQVPQPILPFGKPVHDRLSIEVARGCTRGCRFCHAGFVYRPVREKRLEQILTELDLALKNTGYEEVSFLSLSTGDLTNLAPLFCKTVEALSAKRIAISLPSLRVGSVDEDLIQLMAKIRKTGLTLAPEAGTQRLRDVINKNITEQAILDYTRKLFALGWNQLKLYFMLGLPTETQEDLEGIYDLCLKILATSSRKNTKLTASVSLFVPKPHTPFQWARQISLPELEERIAYLRKLFKQTKSRLTLKWHNPKMSIVEGIFSRGGRELAPVLVDVYQQGEILSNWDEFFHFEHWIQALSNHNLKLDFYLGEKDLNSTLPWDHLSCGLKKEYLKQEWEKSLQSQVTPDCRGEKCTGCGVCDFKTIYPRLDQVKPYSLPELSPGPKEKKLQFRLCFAKLNQSAYLSQLELQKIFERLFRRLELPLSFSQGFHPMPLISFGQALPVGMESLAEYLHVFLSQETNWPSLKQINASLPVGLKVKQIKPIALNEKIRHPKQEEFVLLFNYDDDFLQKQSHKFELSANWLRSKTTKGKLKTYDLKQWVQSIRILTKKIIIRLDWQHAYLNPLFIFEGIWGELSRFKIIKIKSYF